MKSGISHKLDKSIGNSHLNTFTAKSYKNIVHIHLDEGRWGLAASHIIGRYFHNKMFCMETIVMLK